MSRSVAANFLVLATLVAIIRSGSFAQEQQLPPAPKRYFNDYAGVTSRATQQEVNERLAAVERETTNQVVVAIFPKMDSALSLDDYTLRVANSWGVGQREKNNGVTLFVFVADRKMRIQVGKGLTRLLPDELSKRILDEQLKPAFEKREFDRGLADGVDAILRAISRPAVDDKVSGHENGV